MNNKIIIGISGLAGSGKDVFADIAVKEYDAIKVPFAKVLKEEIIEFLINNDIQFEYRNLYGTQKDKEELFNFHHFNIQELDDIIEPYVKFINGRKYASFRSLLQVWGTEYRRSQDLNYWINKTLEQCTKNKIYVIPDCRFLNEVDIINYNNGYIVRINREDVINISNINHPSEVELQNYNGWDYVIDNNSTLSDYQNKCRLVLEDIICLEN